MLNKNSLLSVPLEKLDLRFKRLRHQSESSIKNMVMSLKKSGQLTPVVVSADDGDSGGSFYILIDGFKRHQAAEILGLPSLMAMVLEGEGALVKAQMYLLNKKNGFTLMEEGLLIRELIEKDGLSQVEVASLVERHKSWVCRRLSMIRSLSAQVVEDIKPGLIPSGSAMSLARLPQCNQADFDTVIQTHQLQARESNRLIDLWCKTKVAGIKEFLIQYPRKALELASKDGSDEIDSQVPAWAAKWFSTLRALERVAAALRLRSKKKIGPLEENLCKMLLETLDHVEKECDEAFESLK